MSGSDGVGEWHVVRDDQGFTRIYFSVTIQTCSFPNASSGESITLLRSPEVDG